MFCTKCGQKLKENAKFCSSCGNQISKVLLSKTLEKDEEEKTSKEKEKKTEEKVIEEKNTSKEKEEKAVEVKNEKDTSTEKSEEVKESIEEEKKNENSVETVNSISPVSNITTSSVNNSFNNVSKKNNNGKFIVIIVMLAVVVALLVAVLFLFDNPIRRSKAHNSRTIMMYISGNDLESKGSIVTSDLLSIDASKIDLNKTNVLIYVGGTKQWHNSYISSSENAIFKLTSDGFKKIETYRKNSMGDYKQFRDYLNYAYKNYPADSMDLILYNHGGAIDGAVYDEFTGDNLSLLELKQAFRESKFNSNNKLNTVLFRTCLNGTLEVANVLAPYADYMIASEEVTYGSSASNVLSFVNNVQVSDDSVTYGKKFIQRYSDQMDEIDPFETITKTYSIIDLSKIGNVNKALSEFSSELKPKDNYAMIARTRSNLFQYASSATNIYDMVDLYTLSDRLSVLSNNKANKLKNSIKDAVVYNWGNNSESKGISIYFPFKADSKYKTRFLSIYKSLGYNSEYYNFIASVNNIQSSNSRYNYNFNLDNNDVSVNKKKSGREFSIKLTDDQVKNYARASYLIFKKESDEYYTPIYGGRDAVLDKDNTLKTNITDNLFMVRDSEDNTVEYILAFQEKKKGQYTVPAVLQNYGSELKDFDTRSVNLTVQIDKKNNIKLTQIIPTLDDDDELVQGVTLKLKNYKSIQFSKFQYKVLDSNGNFTLDWKGNPTLHLWEISDKNGLSEKSFKFERGSLDDKDGEYYCVFMITDIKNNTVYSKMVKISN